MSQDQEVDNVVHIVVLDAEVVAGEPAPVRLHDGELQATKSEKKRLTSFFTFFTFSIINLIHHYSGHTSSIIPNLQIFWTY